MRRDYRVSDRDEQKAADLVTALKKRGLDLNIRIAADVIADMHEMAKERRLKALQTANQ